MSSGLQPHELAHALHELGPHVAYPATPDLAAAVSTRLEEGAPPSTAIRLPRPYWRPHPALVAAIVGAALIVAAGGVLSWPAARRAVADWLGVPGIRIQTDSTSRPSPSPARLDIGLPTTLAGAQAEVNFDISIPAALGDPDQLFLRRPPDGGMVTLVYRTRPGLRSRVPGIGLVLGQFEGRLRPDLLFKKITSAGTRVRGAEVNGLPAYWLSGAAHTFLYVDEFGDIQEDSARLAGNVLLWERAGVTYRLESELSLQAAVAIAESLR